MVSPTSRFRFTPLMRTAAGKDTYGRMVGFEKLRNIPGSSYELYVVPNGLAGRPDLIALEFYGNQHLDWILVMTNRPSQPLHWPSIGETIKIPHRDFVNGLF